MVAESAAVVQFTPRGRDQEGVVGLPVHPIVEEFEAVAQATPHVRDQGHNFEQSVNCTVPPIIEEIAAVFYLFTPHERDQQRHFQ